MSGRRASTLERCADGTIGAPWACTVLDVLNVVDALEVHRGDAEVAVAELALDYHERYAFVSKLDGGAWRSCCGAKRRRTPAAATDRDFLSREQHQVAVPCPGGRSFGA
jgi:hypothetical protein